MGMRTSSPWWASLAFGIGLLLFLLGERFFSGMEGVRFVTTGLGLLLIVGTAAVRLVTTMRSTGARRRVEGVLLRCHIGSLIAIALYVLSTDWGMAKLGLSDVSAVHASGALTVLYLAVLAASVIPLLMMELSLGSALRSKFDLKAVGADDAGVEYRRVREIGWSGLSVGFAMAFLLMTCQVANERNLQHDVSYFKTSSPGDSTQKIIATSSDPIKVLLFFPETNDVKTQVKGYFDALSTATGRLAVETHDRLADAELAAKYKVSKDGAVVLVRGTGDKEKTQTVDIDVDLIRARSASGKLRNLDREINSALLKLMRDKRKVYLTVGHGELNDPDSIPPEQKARVTERPVTLFKPKLTQLNYEVKSLGLIDLAKDVPEDASMVIVFGPSVPLQDAEWAALSRYLDRGGHLMIALDPSGASGMGPFEAKFGLKMIPGHLSDDQVFFRHRSNSSDHRNTATNQFSPHASVTELSHLSTNEGILLVDSGALDDTPLTGKDAPKKTITIRSLETSYMDQNDNFVFDDKTEKKQHWNIGAAIEGNKIGDKDGYRVLVYADTGLFMDLYGRGALGQTVAQLASRSLLDSSVQWLGGEELISGEVVTEDDKPIQHTKNEDVVWFTLMIIGVPLVVLTLGLVGTRQRRRFKKTEVTP